jgi:hypothetical protein
MTLQVAALPIIVILTTLEVSFALLENIYSSSITHDDRHDDCNIFIVHATGKDNSIVKNLSVGEGSTTRQK